MHCIYMKWGSSSREYYRPRGECGDGGFSLEESGVSSHGTVGDLRSLLFYSFSAVLAWRYCDHDVFLFSFVFFIVFDKNALIIG